jgi:hypothetical protein
MHEQRKPPHGPLGRRQAHSVEFGVIQLVMRRPPTVEPACMLSRTIVPAMPTAAPPGSTGTSGACTKFG